MTKGNRLSKRNRNVLSVTTIFIFIIISFKYTLLTKLRSIWLDIWPNSFFCVLLDFLEVLFFLVGYATRLRSSLGRYATSSIEARLPSLLRTYKRSTYSKSSILFTDTKSAPMKKWATPIYATCTCLIMPLICSPKFWISIIFNFSWDGCKTQ